MSINLMIGGGFHLSLFGRGFNSVNEELEEFKCSECGANVTSNLSSCPKCSAIFEHEVEQKNYSSWSEYFGIKFGHNHLVQNTEGKTDTYRTLSVTSTHEERRTYITVELYSDNGVEYIETIHFGSRVNFSWWECYLGGQPLTREAISLVNQLLEVPLRKTWTEIDYYFLGINYKTQAILPFSNAESSQTTMHLLSIPFWLLTLFDLLSSRKERQVSALL